MTEAEVWLGAGACMGGVECPENASDGFLRGYGLAYSAGENEMNAVEVIEQFLTKEKTI